MSMNIFDSISVQFPTQAENVAAAFENCKKRKKFVEIPPDSFQEHLDMAKDDLLALDSDVQARHWRWVIIKAYYAVFHATNALLIKKQGYFSKDHLCAVLALKHENILKEEMYVAFREIYERFSDIFGFAIFFEARKLSQYDVAKWKDLKEEDAMIARAFALKYIAYVERECT